VSRASLSGLWEKANARSNGVIALVTLGDFIDGPIVVHPRIGFYGDVFTRGNFEKREGGVADREASIAKRGDSMRRLHDVGMQSGEPIDPPVEKEGKRQRQSELVTS